MALRTCRECGGRVSSKAKVCPSCGAPAKRGCGCGCSSIILLGILVLIILLLPGIDRRQPEVTPVPSGANTDSEINQQPVELPSSHAAPSGSVVQEQTKAEILRIRLVPWRNKADQPAQMMYTTWKNTGEIPIRTVKARFTFRNTQKQIIHKQDFILSAALDDTERAVNPGRTFTEPRDEGIIVFITSENGQQLFSDSVEATVLAASETADTFLTR